MPQLDDIRNDFGLCCSPENQWQLLYFGTVLSCNWNILEALATTSMLYTVFLTRSQNYVLARIRTEFYCEIRASLGNEIRHHLVQASVWATPHSTLYLDLREDAIALWYPKRDSKFKGVQIRGSEVSFLELGFDCQSRRFRVGELFDLLNTVVATTLATIS